MDTRRVSIGGVVAQSGGAVLVAATVLLSASLAVANPGDGSGTAKGPPTYKPPLPPGTIIITADLDLPVAPPSLNANPGPPVLKDIGVVTPLKPPVPQRGDPGDLPAPTFFGEEIPTETASIIYVIDISGSMSLSVDPFLDENGQRTTGNRLDRAKVELRRSISNLPESFSFNVVAYDECVRPMWNSSQVASSSNKQVAMGWIAGLVPLGWTNTGLAAATALSDKSNMSVVLLSDGAPNFLDCAMHYVGSYDQHRDLIRSQNTQGARINAFGIGIATDPAARDFMMAVAQENSGAYFDVN